MRSRPDLFISIKSISETCAGELAQLKTLYTPTNYKVERLQAQIAETERAMEEERKATVARMGNEYAAASRLETLLADAHARQLRTAEQEMANDRQYNTLKSEIDTTQKLYETVLQKAKEAGAASALRATNIRLIDAATVPSEPYSPKTPLNMAIGFALGTLGGSWISAAHRSFRQSETTGRNQSAGHPGVGRDSFGQRRARVGLPRRRID